MRHRQRIFLTVSLSTCFLIYFIGSSSIFAGETYIAVAANFIGVMDSLAKVFYDQSGNKLTPVFGSTGKLFAQINSKAPFDAFFAADAKRPELLDANGIAKPGSRFTYAVGKLVLWSPDTGFVDSAGAVLKNNDFRYVAIANPELAPYGAAAKQVLEGLSLWQSLLPRLVQGENIIQAYHYVISGNAELGFIAFSQINNPAVKRSGSYWDIPDSLYAPIEQQAVLLSDSPIAKAFLDFVKSETARNIIRSFGYGLPDTLTVR
jgi:molybdate transport system substrate-binding protein